MMERLNGPGRAAREPERFTLEVACAATDRTFTAVFVRPPGDRLFRVERVDPVLQRPGLFGRAMGLIRGGGPAMRVDAEEVDRMPDPCPGCGLRPCRYTLCAWCKAFVCTARQRGTRFKCRDSCGVSFETQPLHVLD